MSEDGCILVVLTWPAPWPPSNTTRFMVGAVESSRSVEVYATGGGNVILQLREADGRISRTFQSQPIVVSGAGFVHVSIEWGRDGFGCRVGPHQLASLHEDAMAVVLQLTQPPSGELKSYADSSAPAACRREVERRRNKPTPEVRFNDRAVSATEDIVRLGHSIQALAEDAARVRTGETHRASAMRAALRELIADLGGKSYRPLLFRVAATLDLALPIYATPSGPGLASVFGKGVVSSVETHAFGTTRTFGNEDLIDLAEWLRRPATAGQTKNDGLQFGELVAKSAEFLGGAHAPPTIPRTLDNLERGQVGALSLTSSVLVKLAEVVVELGTFVLGHANRALPTD